VLLDDPHLLLLDEPTNHLDIDMLEWLEAWLANFLGGALIVSHDRTFLDRAVTRILAMDVHQKTIHQYLAESGIPGIHGVDRCQRGSSWTPAGSSCRTVRRLVDRRCLNRHRRRMAGAAVPTPPRGSGVRCSSTP